MTRRGRHARTGWAGVKAPSELRVRVRSRRRDRLTNSYNFFRRPALTGKVVARTRRTRRRTPAAARASHEPPASSSPRPARGSPLGGRGGGGLQRPRTHTHRTRARRGRSRGAGRVVVARRGGRGHAPSGSFAAASAAGGGASVATAASSYRARAVHGVKPSRFAPSARRRGRRVARLERGADRARLEVARELREQLLGDGGRRVDLDELHVERVGDHEVEAEELERAVARA